MRRSASVRWRARSLSRRCAAHKRRRAASICGPCSCCRQRSTRARRASRVSRSHHLPAHGHGDSQDTKRMLCSHDALRCAHLMRAQHTARQRWPRCPLYTHRSPTPHTKPSAPRLPRHGQRDDSMHCSSVTPYMQSPQLATTPFFLFLPHTTHAPGEHTVRFCLGQREPCRYANGILRVGPEQSRSRRGVNLTQVRQPLRQGREFRRVAKRLALYRSTATTTPVGATAGNYASGEAVLFVTRSAPKKGGAGRRVLPLCAI